MLLLLEQTARMRAEVEAIKELLARTAYLSKANWGFTDEKDLCVDFDFVVKEHTYEARLVFPVLFPQAPAYVRPRTADKAWSSHQYPSTGTLCLEWGPDNWHSGVTGADLIQSTMKLLVLEKLGPIVGVSVPTRHDLTLGQLTRFKSARFLLTEQLNSTLHSASRAAPIPLAVATLIRHEERVAMATELGQGDDIQQMGVPAEIADDKRLTSWIRNGWVVWCDEFDTLPSTIESQSVVRDYLMGKDCWPWPDDELRTAFLLLVDQQMKVRPIAFTGGGEGKAFEYYLVWCPSSENSRQPPRNATLQSKKVAIVGLGSVGSKVAVSLARSGVKEFMLIDDDLFLPGNLSRNQLDWLSVGYDKVDAVRGAIELVQPGAHVVARNFRFAGQESAAANTTVLEQVAACDLVIDATASPKVFSSLAAICARRKVPMVWGKVYAGGIGAMMGRSLPGFDADALQIRRAVHEYLADKPEAPFKNAGGYDVEEAGEVFVGGDAEVTALSASLTQFSIDALVGAESPRFPNSAYLIGYQKAWIFEAPFDTHPVPCPRAQEDGEDRGVSPSAAEFSALLAAMDEGLC